MTEHYNSEEYNSYLEWKKDQEKPVLKTGDPVRVPRSDETIDDIDAGWKIRYLFPSETNEMIASVVNVNKGIKKEIPLSVLEKYNSK